MVLRCHGGRLGVVARGDPDEVGRRCRCLVTDPAQCRGQQREVTPLGSNGDHTVGTTIRTQLSAGSRRPGSKHANTPPETGPPSMVSDTLTGELVALMLLVSPVIDDDRIVVDDWVSTPTLAVVPTVAAMVTLVSRGVDDPTTYTPRVVSPPVVLTVTSFILGDPAPT